MTSLLAPQKAATAARADAATDDDVSLPLLMEQVTAEEVSVRAAVAGNPRLPVLALRRLAGDKEISVRVQVAQNPSTPPSVLVMLAAAYPASPVLSDRLDAELLRVAVAANRGCPPYLLQALASDEELYVRAAVAANPATPVATLTALAYDDTAYEVWESAAGNPSLPPDQIADLANDFETAVARNTSTPPQVLHALGKSYHGWVRLEVAQNPATSCDTLAALYADPYEPVKEAAQQNRPEAVRAWMATQGMDADLSNTIPAEWLGELFSL